MKYGMLFLALLASSCGDYNYGESNRVGDIRSLNSIQMSSFEQQNIVRICEALQEKEQSLDSVTNTSFTFSTSQVDCDGNNVPAEDMSVRIQNENGGYFFKQVSNGLNFIFPDVPTTSSGPVADICSSLSNLVNPIIKGKEVKYFKTTGINPSDCETEGLNEICINVESATIQADGASAVVHTKEWLRVRAYSSDLKFIGYVTSRKKISKGFCGRDEVLTLKASLKTK